MNSGQNPLFALRTQTFSFSREMKISLAMVLACHLLLLGWIGFTGNEPTADITPPMTGILLSGGSGTGTGIKGHDTGTPEMAGGSSSGMEKRATIDESAKLKEKRQTMPSEIIADAKTRQNASPVSHLSVPKKASSASGTPIPASTAETGHGSKHGSGNGTAIAGGSGKGTNGFSGPSADAGFFSNPKPPYPAVSRRMSEEGTVLLFVHIQADGRVDEVKLKHSSGFSRLDDSAIKTVRHWRYIPAKQNGKPIPYWYAQPIRFSLDD